MVPFRRIPELLSRLLLATALFAATAVTAGAPSADAACGDELIAAGAWLDGDAVAVRSNTDANGVANNCGGGSAGFGWQCVDLAYRLYNHRGWGTVHALHDKASLIPEGSPGLDFHPNGSGYEPVPGDLIIERGSAANEFFGHVAIVHTNSSRLITAAEQNGSATGWHDYTISSNGTITGGYGEVKGVVHSPNNTLTNGGDDTGTQATTGIVTMSQAFASGFEDGWEGWVEVSGGGAEDTGRVQIPHDGTHSMRVDGLGAFSRVQKDIAVNGNIGDTYVADVMVRSRYNAAHNGKLVLFGPGTADTKTTHFTVGTEWTLVRVTLTLTQPQSTLRINLVAPGGNALLYDSVTMSQAFASGFEDGWEGWVEVSGGGAEDTGRVQIPHDGTHSMRVDGLGAFSRVQKDIAVNGNIGDTYVADVMVRSRYNAAHNGKLVLFGPGTADTKTTHFTVGTEWTLVRVTLTLTQPQSTLRINLVAPGGNALLYDSVTMSQAFASGFEDGWEGWVEVSGGGAEDTGRVQIPHDGTHSMRVDGLGAFSRVQKDIAVNGNIGDTYVADVMVRSRYNAAHNGKLVLFGPGTADTKTTHFTVGTEWTLVRVTLTLTQPQSTLRINLVAPGGNALLYDSVTMR